MNPATPQDPDALPPAYSEWFESADPKVAEIAHDIGLKQLSAYESFLNRVETKATGILSTVSLCITLVVSFGGWTMLEKAHGTSGGWLLVPVFVVALGMGLRSGYLASRVLAVTDLGTINDSQIFAAELPNDSFDTYYKVLILHIWMVVRRQDRVVHEKSKKLAQAQWWFVGFIAALFVLTIVTAVAAFVQSISVTKVAVTSSEGAAILNIDGGP
jgi:hypothetical protein